VILRSFVLAGLVALAAGTVASSPAGAVAGAQRVVSLTPVTTEDLFALGAGDRVVGVSEYSDYPPGARRLPIVGSYSAVATERILALHPDLVLGIAAQRSATTDLRRAQVRVVLLADDSYAGIFTGLETIGRLTGESARARALVARLRARTAQLIGGVRRRARAPRVFVVLGTAPIYTVGRGSYITTLIALAGGRDAAGELAAPYARYSAEALVADQPDALIVDGAVGLDAVLNRPPWSALRAVRAHRVYTLPDTALLERPGPRYNEGLAWLIATIGRIPT
jgi:ABC-type Fe3+-hydroxamate transport system substrate-binding protein